MDKTLFYSLPKDVLIELLCKVYGNLDGFSMQDIHRLHKICQTKMEEERRNEIRRKNIILYKDHIINDHLTIYYSSFGEERIFIRDNRFNDYPKFKDGRYHDTMAILDIDADPASGRLILTKNRNGFAERPNLILKTNTYKDLVPYITEHLKLYKYNNETIEKCFEIIELLANIRKSLGEIK